MCIFFFIFMNCDKYLNYLLIFFFKNYYWYVNNLLKSPLATWEPCITPNLEHSVSL